MPPNFEINCATIGPVTVERGISRSNGKNRYNTNHFITINGEKFRIEDGAAYFLLQNPQIGIGTATFSALGVVKSVEISSVCNNSQ